jgi:hypothetical protein
VSDGNNTLCFGELKNKVDLTNKLSLLYPVVNPSNQVTLDTERSLTCKQTGLVYFCLWTAISVSFMKTEAADILQFLASSSRHRYSAIKLKLYAHLQMQI